jgi:DNA-binding MarR family transcriptional regulator
MTKDIQQIEEQVLFALRQICREIDLHSRRLAREHDLTTPQLLCMRQLHHEGLMMPSELAERVALSQATVTGILDRLSSRGFIRRRRDPSDGRRVILTVTEEGEKALAAAPRPLHDRLASKLAEMPASERTRIASTLTLVATIMATEDDDEA